MDRIIENDAYRNRRRVFQDRSHAGRVLANMLDADRDRYKEPIVLGIPMGGVPVAAVIRDRLACPMDLIIVRKLQIPGNSEAGFGAMTAEGDLFLNEALMAGLRLSDAQIDRETAAVRKALDERNRRLRRARPFPDITGKTVFVVDDGLASGFTMKAALFMVNKRRPRRTIVVVPTAPQRSIDALANGADAIVCANVRDVDAFAVAEAYTEWRDLTESEVRPFLDTPHAGDGDGDNG